MTKLTGTVQTSTIVSRDCEWCCGEGMRCLSCEEPDSACECDPDESDIEGCRECDSAGTIEVEICETCREDVDNCTCEAAS